MPYVPAERSNAARAVRAPVAPLAMYQYRKGCAFMNICIVGTGYVGLVTAACLAEMGNHIVCVDSNPDVISGLRNGGVHIFEPGLEPLVKRNVLEGRLDFSTDMKEGMEHALFIFNCVGTPPREDGSCDVSQIQAVARHIGELITEYKIIVNKSTVPVGTADEVHRIIAAKPRGAALRSSSMSSPTPSF
jgi:UDPglucose 6-dehydrogenase